MSAAASVSGPVVHSPAYVSGYAAYGNPYYPSPAAAAAIDPSTAAAAVAAGMPQYLTLTQQPHQAMAAPYLTHTGMGINTGDHQPQYSISYPIQQQHQQQQQQQAYTSFPQVNEAMNGRERGRGRKRETACLPGVWPYVCVWAMCVRWMDGWVDVNREALASCRWRRCPTATPATPAPPHCTSPPIIRPHSWPHPPQQQ